MPVYFAEFRTNEGEKSKVVGRKVLFSLPDVEDLIRSKAKFNGGELAKIEKQGDNYLIEVYNKNNTHNFKIYYINYNDTNLNKEACIDFNDVIQIFIKMKQCISTIIRESSTGKEIIYDADKGWMI